MANGNNNGNGRERYIISVGGSLIIPNGTVDTAFVKNLNSFIRKKLAEDSKRQFFLVAGGGWLARHYRDAGEAITGKKLAIEDLDWLGIHATRLNAHLLRTIFRDIAHPHIIKHYDIIRKVDEQVAVASGWKPGWSTDYDAVLLAEDYHVSTVINLSNIDYVYNKNPNEFPDAKPFKRLSWDELRKITGDEWSPGMHAPFDPIAAKKAEELGVRVVMMRGGDWNNLNNYLSGKKFIGTIIG